MITLVLGGARSGKSRVAERLAAQLPAPVTYLATALISDEDHAARVALHRARRDATWATIETGPDLAGTLREVAGSVLVDSLGTWLAAHDDFAVDVGALCAALTERAGSSVVVSEEVGLGVHPSSSAGRRFRDVLGTANCALADVCDKVLLVVAGRMLPLDRA